VAQAPEPSLGDEVPLSLLDTDIGARQVEDVLIRLEYGFMADAPMAHQPATRRR